jgi:peptidoglycan biosynthesis protein MviN/MurJ (putative lipid II flippase)
MPTALIGGAVLTVVGIFLSEPLLKMMDTPITVLPLSTVYMQIYFGGMIFNMVYNFCASILRAAGDTKSPLIYLTLAGVINVILNVFFVIVFHEGQVCHPLRKLHGFALLDSAVLQKVREQDSLVIFKAACTNYHIKGAFHGLSHCNFLLYPGRFFPYRD